MKRWMMALGTLMVASAACKPLVLNGGGGGEGGSAQGGSSGTGGSQAGSPSALAMRLGDAPPEVIPAGGPASQAPTDPDTLVVFFSSNVMSCAAPLFAVTPCSEATSWELVLFIPPSLQGSGPIDLTSPEIYFHAYEQLPSPSSSIDGCAGGEGEGPGTQGTLVIDSSNPNALALTLSGGVTAMATTIDGTYVAATCP